MSFTWNPRLVKTPTPFMSAMTIAVAVAVDTFARLELPLLAGIIRLLATWEPAYRCSPLCPQAGKRFSGEKNRRRRSESFRAFEIVERARGRVLPSSSSGGHRGQPS